MPKQNNGGRSLFSSRHLHRFIYVALISFALLGSNCVGPAAGSGGGLNCAAPNGLSFGGAASDSGDDTYSLEGSPVSLPVTIAKNIDGVDASSMTFQPSTSTVNLVNGVTAFATSNVMGTTFFRLVDQQCGDVAVIIDGQYSEVLTADTSDNCLFSHTITQDLIDVPIAYSAFGSGSTVNNGGSISSPIVGIVKTPTGRIEEFTLTVIVTYVDNENTDTRLTADIQPGGISFLSESLEEFVIFPTLSIDGSTELWRQSLINGVPEFFSSVVGVPQDLQRGNNRLVGRTTANQIFEIDPDGVVSNLTLSDFSNLSSNFKVHPSFDYLAYSGSAINPTTNEDTEAPSFFLFSDSSTLGPLTSGSNSNITNMTLDWLDSSTLVMASETDTGQYYLHTANFADSLDGVTPANFNAELLATSGSVIKRPVSDQGANQYIFYICESNNIANICRYDQVQDSVDTVIAVGEDIKDNFKISSDRLSFLTFQLDDEDGTIGIYNIDTDEINFVAFGGDPTPAISNKDIISYQTIFNNSAQVGIINLESSQLLSPNTMIVQNARRTLTVGNNFTLNVVGGSPPYAYTIVSGQGQINQNTGLFTATQKGDVTIKVEDQDGRVATASVTVPGSGDLDSSFDANGFIEVEFTGANSVDIERSLIQSDGKLLVLGKALYGDRGEVFMIRYDSQGNLDQTFGSDGIVTHTRAGQYLSAFNFGLLSNGNIIVGVANSVNGELVAYNSTGSIDTTFGTMGIVTMGHMDSLSDIYVDSNDVTYVLGSKFNADADFNIIAYDSSGNASAAFNGGAVKTFDYGDYEAGVKILTVSGTVYVMGLLTNGQDQCFLSRVLANGTLDNTFGTGGTVTSAFGTSYGSCSTLKRQSDGKVIIAGYGNSNAAPRWSVARYESNGALDTTFGNSGNLVYHASDPNDYFESISDIEILSSGKLLVAGARSINASTPKIHLIRFNSDASIDTSFGTDGKVTFSVTAGFEGVRSVTLDSNGKVYLTGSIGPNQSGLIFKLFSD